MPGLLAIAVEAGRRSVCAQREGSEFDGPPVHHAPAIFLRMRIKRGDLYEGFGM